MTSKLQVAITLDVDWAPDFVIDYAADRLQELGLNATWFVTHASPAVDRIGQQDSFELGIHPNFLPGSSHGADPAEVLDCCLQIVPAARCVRMHHFYQTTPVLETIVSRGLKLDCSCLLPHQRVCEPVLYRTPVGTMVRIPTVWEDDVEAWTPTGVWQADGVGTTTGVAVLNFHPILLYLNAHTLVEYEQVKTICPDLQRLTPQQIGPPRVDGPGPLAMLQSLAHWPAAADGGLKLGHLAQATLAEAEKIAAHADESADIPKVS